MENNELLRYYLDLSADGQNLDDTYVEVCRDVISVRQPIDDEEDSNYVALRENCDAALWEMFTLVFDKWVIV